MPATTSDVVRRHPQAAVLSAVVLVTTAVIGLWIVHAVLPGHVARPARDASPTEVVRTYVRAVNARDYATANSLVGGSMFRYGYHLPFRAERLSGLAVHSVTDLKLHPDGDGGTADHYRQAWEVDVTLTRSHAQFPAENGRAYDGYILARNSDHEPWRIVDEGCC